MSIRNYTQGLLNRRLQAVQAERENLQHRERIQGRTDQSLASLVPSLVQGGVSALGQVQADQARQQQMRQQLAMTATPGEQKPATPSAGSIADHVGKAIQPYGAHMFGSQPQPQLPQQEEEVGMQQPFANHFSAQPGIPPPEMPEPSPVHPVEDIAVQQAQDAPTQTEQTIEGSVAKDYAPVAQQAAAAAEQGSRRGSQYEPLQWQNTVEDEAEMFFSKYLKQPKGEGILSWFEPDANPQHEMLLKRMAAKSIFDQRAQIEQQHQAAWLKNKQLDISAEGRQEMNAAKIERMRALTELARQKGMKIDFTSTTSVLKELNPRHDALKQTERLTGLGRDMMAKGGPGFPSQIETQKLSAYLKAAAADVDSTGVMIGSQGGAQAGGMVGAGTPGVNAQGMVGANLGANIGMMGGGGKYIDDKVVDDAFRTIAQLNVDPKQREFLREGLLMTQSLGKAREGGRMTDADLRFYVENMLNAESPEMFFNAMSRRSAEILDSYKPVYGVLALSRPEVVGQFSDPSQFEHLPQTIQGLASDWRALGYVSEEEFVQDQARRQQAAYGASHQALDGLNTKGAQTAGRAGYQRLAPVQRTAPLANVLLTEGQNLAGTQRMSQEGARAKDPSIEKKSPKQALEEIRARQRSGK